MNWRLVDMIFSIFFQMHCYNRSGNHWFLCETSFGFKKQLITFCGLIIFTTCTTPVSQPKQSATPETVTAISNFDEKKLDNNIDFFLNELSKKYTIQQDSTAKASFKNDVHEYFKAFSLTEIDRKNRIEFQFYGFSKIALCDTAGQKLLNKLGDLTKVKPGENLRYIKSSPWFIIKNENEISLMKYTCENNLSKDKITSLKQLFEQQFATIESEIINVECGGPLEWL